MRDAPSGTPILQTLRHALSGFPGIELAIVFGSVAKGCARFDSDLDIAVQSAVPLTTDDRLALIEAGMYVQTIEKRQGLKVACLEEIGYANGWLGKEQVLVQARALGKTAYGQYLKKVVGEGA